MGRNRNVVITRRTFLGATIAAGISSSSVSRATHAVARQSRLPLAFSTLGCPKWEWRQILDFAAAHNYAAIEVRGLLGEMDLSKRPEFSPAQIPQTKREVAALGVKVVSLDASARMHERDATKRTAQLNEARRFIDLARDLGVPYVRVFGDKYVEGEAKDETRARIASGLRELGAYAAGKNVVVLLEAHGDFTTSESLLDLMKRAASPHVALLWDAHHTFAFGREEPEYTYRQLKTYIRFVQVKDSRPGGKGREYVLTGAGDVPIERQLRLLDEDGYRGFYSFEWEKFWHPEIEEPEIALAHFAKVARGYFANAKSQKGK